MNADVERFGTVVIGAGQAGLASGYHLARRGMPFVILEAGDRIGDSWRRRWDSLRLFTPACLDGLPGLRYPAPAWSFPTKDGVADYLETYARRFMLPVRTGVRVDQVSYDGEYRLAAGPNRFQADSVVVATGPFAAPRLPVFAPELDADTVQLHSSQYRNPAQLRPGGVLVVGAGNSGAEIALEVRRAGHPTWLSGHDTGQEAPFRIGSVPDRLLTPLLWLLMSRLLTVRTAAGRRLKHKGRTMGWPLVRVKPDDLTAAGIERVAATVGVSRGLPALADGQVLGVSNVIWCTGFRPDYRWVDLPVFDAQGFPEHDHGVVASHPGLFFVGEFFLHLLTSSLIGGVGRDAEHIARTIASRRP